MPIIQWLPRYRRTYVWGDIIGGLSVAALFVPGAMAEASLAGIHTHMEGERVSE